MQQDDVEGGLNSVVPDSDLEVPDEQAAGPQHVGFRGPGPRPVPGATGTWTCPPSGQRTLAQLARPFGIKEVRQGDAWKPLKRIGKRAAGIHPAERAQRRAIEMEEQALTD
eukprot:9135555-Lingulodinium_polyedra.AAC.1